MYPKEKSSWHFIAVAAVFLTLLSLSMVYIIGESKQKKAYAQTLLSSYEELILLHLQRNYNYADELSSVVLASGDASYFEEAAKRIMERPGCIYVELLEGTQLSKVYPYDEQRQKAIGTDIKNLDYAYTLARLTRDLVVEGPVEQNGRQVFLVIQSLFETDEAGKEKFLGEAVVALDSQQVVESLQLDQLIESGYAYELWRVHPLDGRKQQIAISATDVDFTQAVETKFELPTIWTLSILPVDGWYSRELMALFFVGDVALTVCLYLLFHVYRRKKELQKNSLLQRRFDSETGLFSKEHFLEELRLRQQKNPEESYWLIYVVYQHYNYFSQLCTQDEKQKLLSHVSDCMNQYVKSDHFAARVGECNFVLAVREESDFNALDNLKKGLALELLWKFDHGTDKIFLTADCESCEFPQNGTAPEELLHSLVEAYFTRVAAQNPARDLADKCQRILQGEPDILLGEYADLEMNRLSKILMRYSQFR